MGATPRPKKHFTSRAESTAAAALDVRCACQFFQSDSRDLLPERINPVGSRPSSSQGYYSRPISPDLTHHVFEPDYMDPETQRNFSFGVVASTDYYSDSTLNSQQNLKVSSNGERNVSNTSLNQEIHTKNSNSQKDPSQSVSLEREGYQKSMDTLRQKDLSQSVLLRRRSESTQKNLENTGRQRDPSTSSILRRRFSDKNVNNIQQRDPSKSSLLRRRMDSHGSLQPQSSIEEPNAKEPKLIESTPVQEPPPREPPTNAERFMLSKNTLQMKPSIELSDLYRETMTFAELESQEQPKPKTFDVGMIDLMTLGTSFIQKGVVKGNKKEKKSKKDKEVEDETPIKTEDIVDEPQELVASTSDTQPSFSAPTSEALVHIGQNIYIEEPGDSPKESAMPVKTERRSRRDYPDKVNKKTDDRQETVENISTTLLPRDLREQSTFSVDSQKIELEKSTTSECIKQRDVSTSSLLQRRYSQNYSFDSPQSTDLQSTDLQTTPSSSTTFVKQRDPSTSSLLKKRYGQSVDDPAVTDDLTSIEIEKTDESDDWKRISSNSNELIDKKTVSFENDTVVVDSLSENFDEEIAYNPLSSTSEFSREKMDWINRTYNIR